MFAAIYARKSTDQSGIADEQKSVARQIDHARAYIASKGWTTADEHVFVDDGVSGAEFATRAGFVRLMSTLKPRPSFQVLVMSEESRLGREAIETAYALKQLVTAGVRVFFYLEDRERTLDSPTDKIMLSLTAFADELEREKARQRTYDAMVRKARARHVTGGRVFGYDNAEIVGADGRRSHVERRINEREAAIVRQIFQMCADGVGKIRIAKRLNAEGAPTPRAQQGRPSAWCASSILAVLYRDLYRGEIVWNRRKKRNAWGLKQGTERPESDWLRIDAPELRVVPEDLWRAAHDRLSVTRAAYLRHQNGRVWGRPVSGVEGKYLLTGIARCGCCGGAIEIRSRSHGRRRVFYYGCRVHWRSGANICANDLEVPMETADAAVLEAIGDDLLDESVVNDVVAGAMAELIPATETIEERRSGLREQLSALDHEVGRLSAAIASGGQLESLLAGLREREERRGMLRSQLQLLDATTTRATEPAAIQQRVREVLNEWRSLLSKHIPQARQIVSKLLDGRLSITPERRKGTKGFRLTGSGSFLRFFGEIPQIPLQAVASPAGFEPAFWP